MRAPAASPRRSAGSRASSTGRAIGVVAMLPLYRSVRELATGLVPAGDPFPVQVGPTSELAQLFRVMGTGPGPEVYAIAHPHFYDRPGIYGDANGDYQDSARRFAFFVLAALEVLPRFVTGPTILHAHDWHTALAPLYLRTTHAHRPVAQQVRTVLAVHNPATRATSPHRWCPRSACRGRCTPTTASSGTAAPTCSRAA